MRRPSFMRQPVRLFIVSLLLFAHSFKSYGEDTYNGTRLTIPSVTIGDASFSNMVVTPLKVLSVSGGAPNGNADSYNPANNELTVPAVIAGGRTYTNAVMTVQSLVSIATVVGADFYNKPELNISSVQVLGGSVYNDVVITESKIISWGGGMPGSVRDLYDPSTRQLTIAALQGPGTVYTNVVVDVGTIVSVGGSPFDDSVLYPFAVPAPYSCIGSGYEPSGLIHGSDGNFYGTTTRGGQNCTGTFFKLTPAGVETVLHSFGPSGSNDGATPNPGLIQDSEGNFYGTTIEGGTENQGTVFKVTPAGVELWIYSFLGPPVGADGASPLAGLVEGGNGNFYGTTSSGGSAAPYPGAGTVFKITPAGIETVIHSFSGGYLAGDTSTDGAGPMGALIRGNDGNFYGTTYAGGLGYSTGDSILGGFGTVFKITPAGEETVLYAFDSFGSDGLGPQAGLVLGNDGNFYGTTSAGGGYGYGGKGTVFRVTPAGVETLLHSFTGAGGIPGSWDGAVPVAALIQGSDGNFYGTTLYGGVDGITTDQGYGTVFKITPSGVESVLHSFGPQNSSDGLGPDTNLIQGNDGNLYGTTPGGGTTGGGTFFELINVIRSP
jgi:uncharacterized repeat protein (TIGR03803 family)